jgi:hypothetical protein
LWLQEGVAKQLETRWRDARPHDEEPPAELVAHRALVTGRSVGVDSLGPSIAMLPTPDAASIAYAEVQSFVRFFTEEKGEAALRLLFLDLKGLGSKSVDSALRSVTGFTLEEWILLHQQELIERHGKTPKPLSNESLPRHEARTLARWIRLGDLLAERSHAVPAASFLVQARDKQPHSAPIRWRAARALLASGETETAEQSLGTLEDLDVVHGAWFALHGRFAQASGDADKAKRAFDLGIAVDPLFDEVACEGRRREETGLPTDEKRRRLCEAARDIPKRPTSFGR